MNDFQIKLKKELLDRDTNKINKNGDKYTTSNSTADTYIGFLKRLSPSENFNNLDFLKDTEEVYKKILSKYKSLYSQKTILAAIIAVLKLEPGKNSYLIEFYNELLEETLKDFKENIDENKKTENQSINWISKDEINEKKKELMDKVNSFKSKNKIDKKEYDTLMKLLLLLIYTEIPARRRKDYLEMYFADDDTDIGNLDKNFFYDDMFVFNNYKTYKSEGRQSVLIDKDSDLLKVINTYIKYHPLLDKHIEADNIPFLVTFDGNKFHPKYINDNLSKIFNKKIGPSLLRSVYVSNNLGEDIKKLKEKAESMGTSVSKMINVYNKED